MGPPLYYCQSHPSQYSHLHSSLSPLPVGVLASGVSPPSLAVSSPSLLFSLFLCFFFPFYASYASSSPYPCFVLFLYSYFCPFSSLSDLRVFSLPSLSRSLPLSPLLLLSLDLDLLFLSLSLLVSLLSLPPCFSSPM